MSIPLEDTFDKQLNEYLSIRSSFSEFLRLKDSLVKLLIFHSANILIRHELVVSLLMIILMLCSFYISIVFSVSP